MGPYTDQEMERWIRLVTTEFYEQVYRDEWLKDVFKVVDQKFITEQQVDFMLQAMSGIKRYRGRNPSDAHPHIFVNEEMWRLREKYLVRAFEKLDCPEDIRQRWLKIDEAFKAKIVMTDPAQCRRRFTHDELVIVPDPRKRAA